MKKNYFITLIAVSGAWILHAQTNVANTNAVAEILALVTTNAPPPKPSPPRAPTKIDSDSADFDLNGHKAFYRGNVRVDDPRIKLTCAQLVVDLPQQGGRVSHIVAETNVVIDATDEKGATNHITSAMAVYDYSVQGAVTNETVTFTGNPQVISAQGTNTADEIVWNRANGHVHEVNPHMVSTQNLDIATAHTNSPAATNIETLPPVTNLPPQEVGNATNNPAH